jgi:hypothetical protein
VLPTNLLLDGAQLVLQLLKLIEQNELLVPGCVGLLVGHRSSAGTLGAEMKNRPPFDLPLVWEKRTSYLKLATPLNFVSTCDLIGGNSGSPVVNRAGEFVGIILDGNLQSLPWDERATAISRADPSRCIPPRSWKRSTRSIAPKTFPTNS